MTPEQQAMLNRAHQSLEAAQAMITQGLWNDAVATGYYAMLHSARAALASFGLSFSSHRGTHGAFGRELTHPGILPAHLHRYLIDGEEDRHQAEYDYTADAAEAEARETLKRAEEFVKAIEEFLREPEA